MLNNVVNTVNTDINTHEQKYIQCYLKSHWSYTPAEMQRRPLSTTLGSLFCTVLQIPEVQKAA